MQIPRWGWIMLVAVSAVILMAGTVWWLRARSLRALPALPSFSKTSLPSSSSTEAISVVSSTVPEAFSAPENVPIFFVPEVPVLPGLQFVPASVTSTSSLDFSAPTVVNEGDLDDDGDGLTNDQERQLSTDIKKIDTDGDALPDQDEVRRYRTNPLIVDTDGDGYSDAKEIQNGYNPLGVGVCLTADCAF